MVKERLISKVPPDLVGSNRLHDGTTVPAGNVEGYLQMEKRLVKHRALLARLGEHIPGNRNQRRRAIHNPFVPPKELSCKDG